MKFTPIGILLVAAAMWVAGCTDTTSTPNSLYSAVYHAGAPVNRDYAKSLVEASNVTFYDSVAGRSVRCLKFVAYGRCSCGAVTDQFFMSCDSNGVPVVIPADSASCGIKVLGEEAELFARGRVQVNSFSRSVDKYTISFSGYVIYQTDTVRITNGLLVGPSPL
jgi:hypothetical protein